MADRPHISLVRRSRFEALRDDISAEWRRVRANMTREQLISNLKTLAWVIPLTLLIWIYAEREQVATTKDVAVPFELVSVDPNRIVSLTPRQDKNLILELQGPQARLQDVLQKLRGGLLPTGLKLEIPTTYTPNREHEISTLMLLQNQKIFSDNGVVVMGCQPSRLEVMIDEVAERDAKIVRPPAVSNLEASFDPPTVRVRGPLSILNKAELTARQEDPMSRLSVYGEIPDEVVKAPGHHDVMDVGLLRPPALEDDRVTILAPVMKIRASVDVRQADVELNYPSMPVFVTHPQGLFDRYMVTDVKPAILQNVMLRGPKEIIDALSKPNFEPKPKARIEITQEDVGDVRKRVVKYDLPDKVQVSDEDKKRTVEFRLVDRPAAAP